MIKVGEETWNLVAKYVAEIGQLALENAAQRHAVGDLAGELWWKKIVRRADVLSALVSPLPEIRDGGGHDAEPTKQCIL